MHGELWAYYSQSKQMRYMGDIGNSPRLDIARHEMHRTSGKTVNKYTIEGRRKSTANLRTNMDILHRLTRNPVLDRSIEYADNRIFPLCGAVWKVCGHRMGIGI